MKRLLLLITALFSINACTTTYTKFIQVEPRQDVPNGAKEIIIHAGIPDLLAVLKEEGIMYNYKEGGVETEEVLIDEATRAKFSIYEFEDALKLVPYWGITDKVRQEIAIWAGYGAASIQSNELTRIVYDKTKSRSKSVFDYAAQISLQAGDVTFR